MAVYVDEKILAQEGPGILAITHTHIHTHNIHTIHRNTGNVPVAIPLRKASPLGRNNYL